MTRILIIALLLLPVGCAIANSRVGSCQREGEPWIVYHYCIDGNPIEYYYTTNGDVKWRYIP
jgi:hypothetical protein